MQVVMLRQVSPHEVSSLLDALTTELADGGYAESETFGYSVEALRAHDVHLVAAVEDGEPVGVGGIELGDDGTAELKRFYVRPSHRGSGAAAAVMSALLAHAAANAVHTVRLETGDKQARAIRFYRRHGFEPVERFGPYVGSATSVCMARSLPGVTD